MGSPEGAVCSCQLPLLPLSLLLSLRGACGPQEFPPQDAGWQPLAALFALTQQSAFTKRLRIPRRHVSLWGLTLSSIFPFKSNDGAENSLNESIINGKQRLPLHSLKTVKLLSSYPRYILFSYLNISSGFHNGSQAYDIAQ